MVISARLRKLLLALVALFSPAASAGDFEDLVAAERAFAADSLARGTRDAFLAVLAPEGVVFAPGPASGKAVWEARTATTAKLEWAPEWAEVSAGGDFGYTSGPWRYTPEGSDKPTVFGHYLSVWQKQPEGGWKLLVDHGVSHAEQPLPDKVVRRGSISAGAAPLWPVGMAELRRADLVAPGFVNDSMIASDFLRLRNGRLPDSRGEGEAIPAPATGRVDSAAVISNAGDMAVTWGGGKGEPSWLRSLFSRASLASTQGKATEGSLDDGVVQSDDLLADAASDATASDAAASDAAAAAACSARRCSLWPRRSLASTQENSGLACTERDDAGVLARADVCSAAAALDGAASVRTDDASSRRDGRDMAEAQHR